MKHIYVVLDIQKTYIPLRCKQKVRRSNRLYKNKQRLKEFPDNMTENTDRPADIGIKK